MGVVGRQTRSHGLLAVVELVFGESETELVHHARRAYGGEGGLYVLGKVIYRIGPVRCVQAAHIDVVGAAANETVTPLQAFVGIELVVHFAEGLEFLERLTEYDSRVWLKRGGDTRVQLALMLCS